MDERTMDEPPRPFARAERTFWTVWNYITEAVGRFLRPVAADTGNSSGQGPTADREADNFSGGDSDVGGGGEDEKRTASAVNSPPSAVAWDQPTVNTDSGPEREDVQYTVESSRGSDSHASEEGEGTTEEQVDPTEDEEMGRHVTQYVSGTEEEKMDENKDEELLLRGKDEIKIAEPGELNGHKDITRSQSISDAALSEDVGEMVITSGREEETDRVVIPISDGQREADEPVMTQFQAKDGEETEEVLFEDEPGDLKDPRTVGRLVVEEKAGKLRMFKDTSPEEEEEEEMENNMYVEDLRRQRTEEDGGLTYEAAMGEETERRDGVSELTGDFPTTEKENRFKPDEGSVEPVAGEVQEPLLKEVSFEDSAVMGGPGIVASEAVIHAESQTLTHRRAIVSGDEITVVRQEQMTGEDIGGIENDKVEDQIETEDRSVVVERKQGINNEEENDIEEDVITNKILYTGIEEEDCLKAVREDSKDEHVIAEHVGGFEDGDQDDETEVLEMVIKASEEDAFEKTSAGVSGTSVNLGTTIADETKLTGIAISIDEIYDVTERDKMEEETVSSKEQKVSSMEETLNTVEVSGELEDMSPGICVGYVVVPQEPGRGACDETQEEVPEYNNGHELDEDTTQWILEAGDCEEMGTTPLPEQLESEEAESLENIVGDFVCLLVSEHKEEERDAKSESAEHIEKNLDMVVEGQTETLSFTDIESPREIETPSADPMNGTEAQVSECSFVAEVGPQAASVKTEPRQSEKTSESSTEHSEKTTAEIEEDVVGSLGETVDSSETEFKNATGAGLSDEPIDTETSEENVAPEGIVETTLIEQFFHTGLNVLADEDLQEREMEIQYEGMSDSGTVVKAVEDKSHNEKDSEGLNMQIYAVETTAGLFKENYGIENALIVGPEPPKDNAKLSVRSAVRSVETKHERSEKPLQTSNQEKMAETELSDVSMEVESEPEEEVGISKGGEQGGLVEIMIELMGNYTEETGKQVIGHGHETDEDIRDMSEDRDLTEPKIFTESTEKEPVEESEPEPRQDIETPPSEVGQDEKLSEEQTEEEQSVEPSTEEKLETESGSVSDEEISETSPSAESGFSDQSVGELDPPENEAQLLKFAHSGLFQGELETSERVSETAETFISDLFAKLSETEDRLIEHTGEAGQSYVEEGLCAYTIPVQGITLTGFLGKPTDTTVVSSKAKHNVSADNSQENRELGKVETETGLRKEIIPEISNSGLSDQTDGGEAKGTEAKSSTEMVALFRDYLVEIKDDPLDKIVSNIPNKMQEGYSTLSNETEETKSVLHWEGSEPEARVMSKESGLLWETVLESHDQLSGNKVHLLDKAQRGWSDETEGSSPGQDTEETTEALLSSPPRTKSGDQHKVDASILDFTPQKSRIAVKNPQVRPPTDPRALLQMPSVEPSPPEPSRHLPIKGLAGLPMRGVGIAIKLPGLGAGFPVLRKTQKGVRDENNTESLSQQKSETEAEVQDASPKEEEAERKPKWMPPLHPGFGNPLMSELKTKLKKTTKE